MNRAYSQFVVKSFDEEKRIFEGIATTPRTDRDQDIIDPDGAEYQLPLVIVRGHDDDKPVANVTHAKRVPEGIWVRGQFPKVEEAGRTKDRVDEAWADVKYGLIRGLSIKFLAKKVEPIAGTRGIRVKQWDWLHLGLVTIPSNVEASIHVIKSYDEGTPVDDVVSSDVIPPGASGTVSLKLKTPKKRAEMNAAEKVTALENARAAKAARLNEIDDVVAKEARTKNDDERGEFDTLLSEIKSIDVELQDARALEAVNKSVAKPVTATTTKEASTTRDTVTPVSVKSREEKGIGFARYAMALMACKGNKYEAAEFAKARWGDQSHEIVTMLKAAVAAGTTTDATWAAPLVPTTNLTNDFLEMLRPATIIGKLDGRFRRVPFNIAMPAQTGGGTYGWVGQGSAKPLTSAAFATVTLGFAKAAGIIVLAEELVKFSNPNAEQVTRDEMIAGIGAFLDVQLTDPAIAAVANVNPASITNGIAGTAASGTTEAAARADLKALLAGFITGNFGLGGVVLIMNEGIAFTLGMAVNAVGEPAFPGITATGGSILGIPVITSNAVTAATGIIAVHAPSILYADDGGVEIDMSREASLQMDSAPANPTTATEVMVSLWQRNLVGLRAERYINWKVARTGAVRRIHTVAYA